MFEHEGSGEWGGGRGASISICTRILYTIEGDESDSCSKNTPLFITRLVMLIIEEGLMLHVVCNPVLTCSKQRVKRFIMCYCTWIERKNISIGITIMLRHFFFYIAKCKKEIHIAKYNRRVDVSCNVTAMENEGENCLAT